MGYQVDAAEKAMRKLTRIMLVLTGLLVMPFVAFGDTAAPPRNYVKETGNGKYLFVMLAPDRWGEYGSREIKKYPASGLYRNDGSTDPLWTVAWYSHEVYPSSDGRHLVEMGPWASDIDQLAVAFHRDGELIKAYAIRDLVLDTSKLKRTVSHFFWRAALDYDDKNGILSLGTTDDRHYRFSVRTGEILPAEKGPGSEPRPEVRTILRKPVEIVATITKMHPPGKDAGGSCDVDILVRKGGVEFMRKTSLIAVDNADQAFEVIGKGTRWTGKYLLVRTECGGGNAWRCNVDTIFTLRGDALSCVGEVAGGDREAPAKSYGNGCFWDMYDKFEMNPLTDHSDAPGFWLALLEKGGSLRADLPRTWIRNRGDFRKRMMEIADIIKGGEKDEDTRRRLESLILDNAVLAKYCGRKSDAARLEKLASRYVEPARLGAFRDIMTLVKPGEYPLPKEKE
jgi:hypothetical protein